MQSLINPRQFRSLMGRFVTGVTVVAVPDHESDSKVMAMTASSVTSVSLAPLLMLFCVRNESRLLPHLRACGHFSVNVLASHQDNISRYYGGQPALGSAGEWKFSETSAPVLGGANASFICTTKNLQAFGDHHVVIGEVFDMVSADPPAPALIYAAGRYMGVELCNP